MDLGSWLKEWALPLSAGATFLLALAAFGAILQNYFFRKADRNRDSIIRSTEELFSWTKESLRLFYLPYNYNKDEIYHGIIRMTSTAADSCAAAIIIGPEFMGLVARATYALTKYLSLIREKRQHEPIDNSVIEEFRTSFEGLRFYLNLLRSWDYRYTAFLKDAQKGSSLPLAANLKVLEH